MTAGVDVLLDTGGLVAALHRDDRDHARCAGFLRQLRGRLLTTEAVLTEATHLLGRVEDGAQTCLEFFIRGGALLVPQSRDSLMRCRDLMTKYADVPMDFADATLVVLAEETQIERVFTLDRRGFTAYRSGKRRSFTILPA